MPLTSVAIHVLGELIRTARGNQFVLIKSDMFTRLTKSVPLKSASTSKVAKAFYKNVCLIMVLLRSYLPKTENVLLRGSFRTLVAYRNIHNSTTTTYHAKTNRQVERFNQTLKAAIRRYLPDPPTDWDLYMPSLPYAYICLPHKSTA